MAEEVALSSSNMTDGDLAAIATYLKSLPGRQDSLSPLRADDPVMAAGSAIYRDQCSACHGIDGKGVAKLFPSLAEWSAARSDDPTSLIRIVLRAPAAPQRPASRPRRGCHRSAGSSTKRRSPRS
jgi:cytochrome c5